MPLPSRPKQPRVVDVVLFLVGIAGIAAGITLLFLEGRALMDIGGFCAEGGPYQIQVHCPHNSALIWISGFLGGGAAIFLAAWKGSTIGVGAGTVFWLAGSAVFGVTGVSSIQSGLDPPGDEPGWAWGYLAMGIPFVAVAILFLFMPLLLQALARWLLAPSSDAASGSRSRRAIPGAVQVRPAASRPGATPAGSGDLPTSDAAAGDAQSGAGDALAGADDVSRDIAAGARLVAEAGGAGPGRAGEPLVDGLERLAALHDDGALTDEEYARAKNEVLEHGESLGAGSAGAGGVGSGGSEDVGGAGVSGAGGVRGVDA